MDKSMYNAKPDKTLKEHCEDLISVLEQLDSFHYIDDEKIYELTQYCCNHHDDGKVNREFQKRVNETKRKIRFREETEIAHNVLSGYFVNPDDFEEKDDYYRVLHAILYHHNYGDALSIMGKQTELIHDLLKEFPIFQIENRTRNSVAAMVNDNRAIKIKGLLHKCDYSASGNFTAEYPNDFLENSLENVKIKWRQHDPSSDWNDLQKFCMEKRNEDIIVIAQTGMGKTEAGLQWIGNHKGYFVLPLRTAINAIYDRVREDILQNKNLNERICILHSDSLEYYSKELDEAEMDLFDYEKKGKQLSLPLSISTMDQLFDFIFKYQGFELKLTTLSYSKIVIDEIQMYDPELLAYLIYGLRCIHEMGGKIAVMTATLSPFVRTLLMREIPFKAENIQTFVDQTIRHNIKVLDYEINSEDVMKKYYFNEDKKKSNKILVVCNTIQKAQELYEEIIGNGQIETSIPVHLLHSRFTKEDRSRLEKEILEFGKTYDEDGSINIRAGIWISTSLVEASLDIDFDYLFTELQDLNSLFQRLGRCNRKGKKDTSETNCYIYSEIEPKRLSGNGGFIDETIFEISRQAIRTVSGTLSETQKIELLNNYLTMDKLKGSGYYQKYKDTRSLVEKIPPYKYDKNKEKLRNILSEDVIPSPIYEEHQEEIHKWEELLLTEKLDNVERMRIRANIMQYSVSIPYWQWMKYIKAKSKGDANPYPEIELSRKEKIQVVECFYDALGYRAMDYKNVIREAEIL